MTHPPALPLEYHYTAYWCEENIYQLVSAFLADAAISASWECFVVLISNHTKSVNGYPLQSRRPSDAGFYRSRCGTRSSLFGQRRTMWFYGITMSSYSCDLYQPQAPLLNRIISRVGCMILIIALGHPAKHQASLPRTAQLDEELIR